MMKLSSISFEEINEHLMKDANPSLYLNEIALKPEFHEYPYHLLLKLKDAEQSVKYHPEGNAWNHTMLVVDEAAAVRNRSKNEKVFMWAALLHDIGKPDTTRIRKGRITSYDHDKVGALIAQEFLNTITEDEDLIHQVSMMVRYHMHLLYVLKKLPFGDIKAMKENVDLYDIALLCLCDRLGRIGAEKEKEEGNYKEFLDIILSE